jgi:uncharacterized protein YciW
VLRGDVAHLDGTPRERALGRFAALVAEAPWTITADDLDRLRAVGLGDEALVQATGIAGFFCYVTRVADATGIDYDYVSPLPLLEPDRAREPLPRPPRERWPHGSRSPRLTLDLRPATAAALAAWEEYLFDRDVPLARRERRLLAARAAGHACDAAGTARHGAGEPAGEREARLAAFADRLSLAPWTTSAADLDALRAAGLDDAALLDAIGTVAYQSARSRIDLALAAS